MFTKSTLIVLVLAGTIVSLASSQATNTSQLSLPVTIPRKAIIRMIIADVLSDIPISDQLKAGGIATAENAWNLDANCYSEKFYSTKDSSLNFQKTTCANVTTIYQNKKCTSSKDSSNFESSIKYFYSVTFPFREGLVSDPFNRENTEKLLLFRSTDYKNFLWVDPTTDNVVYLLNYRGDLKRVLLYHVPKGMEEVDEVSSFYFMIFKCAKY